MPTKKGYLCVDRALEELDHDELSRLGKKGVMSKKERELSKIKRLLAGAAEAARQANLDICPIGD